MEKYFKQAIYEGGEEKKLTTLTRENSRSINNVK